MIKLFIYFYDLDIKLNIIIGNSSKNGCLHFYPSLILLGPQYTSGHILPHHSIFSISTTTLSSVKSSSFLLFLLHNHLESLNFKICIRSGLGKYCIFPILKKMGLRDSSASISFSEVQIDP